MGQTYFEWFTKGLLARDELAMEDHAASKIYGRLCNHAMIVISKTLNTCHK